MFKKHVSKIIEQIYRKKYR